MKNIVFASGNKGKLQEFAQALPHYTLIPQSEFNTPEAVEDGSTFVENALIKAKNACVHSNLPAIADDSGLVIPALNGAPGIYSSRYAGEYATDADNIKQVLKHMNTCDEREACFYAVVVYMRSEYDPAPIIATGMWHGELLREIKGTSGFGYDPIFYLPELDKTSAELTLKEKNLHSHRGQAIAQLVSQLTAQH